MEHKAKILIIEDEAPIRKLLQIALEAHDCQVLMAQNAREGRIMAATHQPDLVLLDLGLPDTDGQVLLQEIRDWYLKPIIILSARDEEAEIIRALDNGANDYLTKPFRTGELLARIRSALRLSAVDTGGKNLFETAHLSVDLAARTVRFREEPLKLTSTEYALLVLFIKNKGKVLTHQQILREVWGPGYVDHTEYPRVFVGQLRKKIEENPNEPRLILTESGIGYRFAG
jgi:two-component system, OmpR family, KDP operon response regulator KdpE